MTIRSYRDLEVWKRSMALVKSVYTLSGAFPADERFGLTSQLRRSAVSIPSNIAEGRARKSTKDFLRFLNIAYGSLAEIETQLLLSKDMAFAPASEVDALLNETAEIARMINGLTVSLEARIPSTGPRPLTPEPSYA